MSSFSSVASINIRAVIVNARNTCSTVDDTVMRAKDEFEEFGNGPCNNSLQK